MARCLIAVVAFLALQATCDGGLLPNVTELVDGIVSRANNLKSQADTAIANIRENIINEADAAVTKIHNDIQNIAQKVRTEVQTEVAKFQTVGKDVVQCTEKIPSEVEELVSDITKSAESCVTNEVKEGESIVTKVKSAGEDLNNTLTNLKPKIDACSGNVFNYIPCSVDVIAKATSSVTNDSTTIFSAIAEAGKLIAGFKTNINSCEAAAIQSVPSKVKSLLGNIGSCYTSA